MLSPTTASLLSLILQASEIQRSIIPDLHAASLKAFNKPIDFVLACIGMNLEPPESLLSLTLNANSNRDRMLADFLYQLTPPHKNGWRR